MTPPVLVGVERQGILFRIGEVDQLEAREKSLVEMNKRSRKFLHAGDLTDQGRTTECGHCTATFARQRDARDDWVPRAAQRPPRP